MPPSVPPLTFIVARVVNRTLVRDESTMNNLEAVYAFIVQYKFKHDGNSPTYGEIMQGCHIPSKATVSRKLGELELAGKIRLGNCASRSIQVVGGQWSLSHEFASCSSAVRSL